MKSLRPYDMIIDFVTGEKVPNIGAEENRQAIEKYLVNVKGFYKEDVEVDAAIEVMIGSERYRSQIDLVVRVDGKRFMAIKCAAGSLRSREREILSAARILDQYPLPRAVVSDGKTAIVLDTVSGKNIDEGMEAIPSRAAAKDILWNTVFQPLTKKHLNGEKLIFRAYDVMNVNVKRNLIVNNLTRGTHGMKCR